jgi:hypothetical protein
MKGRIITLLSNGLDLSPDSLILGTKEERQNLVELQIISTRSSVFSPNLQQ